MRQVPVSENEEVIFSGQGSPEMYNSSVNWPLKAGMVTVKTVQRGESRDCDDIILRNLKLGPCI